MNTLPFWDVAGRTMSLGQCALTIEGLLRLQNTKHPERPITLYILGNPQTEPLTPVETLMVCDVIRSLRSPVQTVGIGFLSPTQSIVLAGGTGRRMLLPHSMLFLTEIRFSSPIDPRRVGINACGRTSPSQESMEERFMHLLNELKIAECFSASQTLCATAAVEHGLADELFQQCTEVQRRESANERNI